MTYDEAIEATARAITAKRTQTELEEAYVSQMIEWLEDLDDHEFAERAFQHGIRV